MRIYGLIHVFGNIIGPVTGHVHKLLMCSWSVPFPLPWFSGGCVFSLVGLFSYILTIDPNIIHVLFHWYDKICR